jgi:hypothetical protein
MEPEGLIALSLAWSLVIATVFAGLLWAAVQDGRDERRSRERTSKQRHGSVAE